MVSVARDNPLLEAILTRTPAHGGDVSLLSLLTVRGEPLIGTAIEVFGGWVDDQWPSVNPRTDV